jgi:hypothetical protein
MMLRWLSSRLIWGTLLVLGGIALLLQNLEILPAAGSLFWMAIFLLGGLAFLGVYFENRENWWAFIPGFTLLGLSASSLMEIILPSVDNVWGGMVFFLGISLGFLFVYIAERQHWWAIIPFGVLLTLGIVALIDNANVGIDSGAVFFLGIGLTFIALALLPGYVSSLRWAYIPGGILILIGLLISAGSSNLINLVFPALLVVVGFLIVFRTVLNR